jgi:aminoglycoside phosphotransferase (APT) family kinase protein
VDELERVAVECFGFDVATRLPVSESFSSQVLSFLASDGSRHVVKRHWARGKAEREAWALTELTSHPDFPALRATAEHDGHLYLLIEGLDGVTWEHVEDATPELLRDLGRATAEMHRTRADSFDGFATWHELLRGNADRYLAMIGDDDRTLAERGHAILERRLAEVPNSDQPCLVHFDLRPGNVLVHGQRFVGIIDFESCRGGHASMDFFKLWQQVAPRTASGLAEILHGYRAAADATEPWMEPAALDRLMRTYSAYHGLAGLAWCHSRNDFSGTFPDVNRQLIQTADADTP